MILSFLLAAQLASLSVPTAFVTTLTNTPVSVTFPIIPSDNLYLWVKADTLSGTNGEPITMWTDSSNNGRYGTNATASTRPYITNSVVNGYPAAYFDLDFLEFNNGGGAFRNVSGSTVFMMMRHLKFNTGFDSFWAWSQGVVDTNFRISMSEPFANNTWTLRCVTLDGGTTDNGVQISEPTGWVLYTFRLNWAAGSAILRTNLVVAITDTAFGSTNTTSNTDSLGHSLGGDVEGNGGTKMQIAEFIIYTSYLDDVTVTNIENYLDAKYLP